MVVALHNAYRQHARNLPVVSIVNTIKDGEQSANPIELRVIMSFKGLQELVPWIENVAFGHQLDCIFKVLSLGDEAEGIGNFGPKEPIDGEQESVWIHFTSGRDAVRLGKFMIDVLG